MKYLNILLLWGAVACSGQPADHFVLRGVVPGAMDSTDVKLVNLDAGGVEIMSAYVIDGKFELRGKLETPVHCKLRFSNMDYIERSGKDMENIVCNEINFFLENGKLTFRTPHIDSLPKSFWEYDIRCEKNYKLSGSAAQDAYYEYQQQTIPVRLAIAGLLAKEELSLDENRRLQGYYAQLNRMGRDFIVNHNNVPVNLHVAEFLKKEPFTYDRAYLDSLEELFASNRDTSAALENFRRYLYDAARFVQGKPVQDAEVAGTGGEKLSLLAQLNPEGATLIDLWASWCAPCRASFPHLRRMYSQYGEKVKFVSVSVDAKEADWQRAMGEEKLPWLQLLAPTAFRKDLGELYGLRGVPTFYLIDRDGRIIFSGHSSGDLELQLDKWVADN